MISGLTILSAFPSILLDSSSVLDQRSPCLGQITGLPLMAFDPGEGNPILKGGCASTNSERTHYLL